MPKRTFVYGAAVLLAANLVNRVLGFTYQYLIMSHIGGEAFGLYNMVFPVYMLALVLTTAGIPLAISKLVSEEISLNRPGQAKAIFHIALRFLFLSGAAVALLLYTISPYLAAKMFPDPRVFKVFLICTPAIFIVSVSSAFRGYFQGLQNMVPSAISQICEQITRVIVGFTASISLLPRGVEWAAAGLAIGMLAGETIGLTIISLQYIFRRKNLIPFQQETPLSSTQTLLRLFRLASPITVGRLLSTGLSSLDAMLIPQRLRMAGYGAREATTLFGQLGGACFTLLTFPSVFTFALATSLVPAISEAATLKQFHVVKARSSEAIRLTIIIGIPSLIILFYFAEALTGFFKSPSMAPVLRILALGGIFSYLQQTTTGILQGLGKVHIPVLHSIIGAIIRIPILYTLTALPYWGLVGTACSYVFGFFIMAILNLSAIIRYTAMPLDLTHFLLQPLSAGIGMLMLLRLFPLPIDNLFFNLIKIVLGGAGYMAILMLNGGIKYKDLYRLPWLGKYIPR